MYYLLEPYMYIENKSFVITLETTCHVIFCKQGHTTYSKKSKQKTSIILIKEMQTLSYYSTKIRL